MEFDFDLEDPAYENVAVKEVTEKVEKKEVKKVVEVVKDEPKKKIVSKEAKVEVEPKVEAVPKEVNKDTKPKKNPLTPCFLAPSKGLKHLEKHLKITKKI